MANEVESNISVAYADGLQSAVLEILARRLTSVGKRYARLTQTVGTSEEAVLLGDISPPGLLVIRNLDPTNYVELKVGTGASIIARLLPDANGDGKGGFVVIERVGSGMSAPFVIANGAPCKIDVFVVEP